jgi:hypothetical protein
MIETSTGITKLTAGLLLVQGEIAGIKRDSTNPHFKNRYASLEAVIETTKPAMQKAKMVFTQAPGVIVDGAVEVTTMLIHESGEWLRSTLHVPLAKTDPQGVGSAITYGCRYALMATLGLPPIDDDAEAAVSHSAPERSRPVAVSQRPDETAETYVVKSKDAISAVQNSKALQTYWASEKPNRDKHRLDPAKGPGLDLVMAYNDRKDELANGRMAG